VTPPPSTPDADPRLAELRALLVERALRRGDFVLASGRRSDYFLDCKQVTLEGRGLSLVAGLMLDRCRDLGVTAIAGDDGVGPLLGAIAARSAATSGTPLRAFMIRKAEKEHGTRARVAGPAPVPNERTLLVEDAATTGGSLLRSFEALSPSGAGVVGALVIVDREEGAAAALRERGLPFAALVRASQLLGAARL
jgi:orotate phosphoribosyltransferase